MEERRKHIDDLFREGLNGYREIPAADVWAALDKRLPAEDEKSSRRWLWYLLLLLLLGTAGYFIYRKYTQASNETRKPQQQHILKDGGTATSASLPSSQSKDEQNDQSAFDTVEAQHEDHKIFGAKNTRAITRNTHHSNSNHSSGDSPEQHTCANKNVSKPYRQSAAKNNQRLHQSHPERNNGGGATNLSANANQLQGTRTYMAENGNDAIKGKNRLIAQNTGSATASGNTEENDINKTNAAKGKNKLNTVQDNVSASKLSGAVKSNKKTKTNINKPKNTGTENDYLLQPVPEEDEDDNITDQEPLNGNNSTGASAEDEQKKKLLYIPPDESLVPIPEAINKVDQKTQNITKDSKTKKNNDEAIKSGKQGIAVKTETFDKNGLVVTGASGNKNPISVTSETFKKKQTATKNSRFGKSKLKVDSEVPTDPGEKIVVTSNSANGSLVNISASDGKLKPAATASVFKEESNTTPASSGGGGGGGGGAQPSKTGSKFRFDLGIKAGYERGFSDLTTNTFIISPYLQWNISTGFAFVFQPGFRYNQLTSDDITAPTKNYHQITNATVTENHILSTDTFGTYIQRNYIYTNSYDSIVVGSGLKTKNFWEIELPVMLRYKIASNFAVFGGISLMLGNMIEMEEKRTSYFGGQKNGTLSYAKVLNTVPPPQIPNANEFFDYSTPDISTASVQNVNPATNPARMGLMFGFSYELQKRVTLDVLYKQTISDMKYVPNEQIRKVYTQPYFRVMLGFKLFENTRQNNTVKSPEGF